MGGLEVLIWILAGIGGLVLLTAIAGVVLFIALMIWGFRLMRDDEASTLPGRADR